MGNDARAPLEANSVPETPSSVRPGRRGETAREALFQRIDAIVGSIRPAVGLAAKVAASGALSSPSSAPTNTTLVDAHVAHAQSSRKEADPVFGRLLERWFALERDRVLGEHLHLDQVKAVATAYAPPDEPDLRVVR